MLLSQCQTVFTSSTADERVSSTALPSTVARQVDKAHSSGIALDTKFLYDKMTEIKTTLNKMSFLLCLDHVKLQDSRVAVCKAGVCPCTILSYGMFHLIIVDRYLARLL